MKKITTNDNLEVTLYLMYCDNKSFVWQMFFGWRETDKDDNYTFIVPTKVEEKVKTLKKFYKTLDKTK
jgi:hypothetical protein